MSATLEQAPRWTPRRWGWTILILLLVHVGLIFWLGERHPIRPRPPAPAPSLELPVQWDPEFLALSDPTLLALPHPQGFAGMAWLLPPPQRAPSFDWSEQPHWLALDPGALGTRVSNIPQTGSASPWRSAILPEPDPAVPWIEPVFDPVQPSRLSIFGALAGWQPTTPFELPAWPGRAVSAAETDVLTNTVVQVMVDGGGRPISATLLCSSGSSAADEFALERVRGARFESADLSIRAAGAETNVLSRLRWGRLVFEWRTLPAAAPNAAPGAG